MDNFGKLRLVEEGDLGYMLSWRNHPEVRKYMYTRHEISLEEHISWWKRTKENKRQKYFMYEYEGVALGVVGFVDIDCRNMNCSWAFYASPDAPRGTGSKMEFLALDFVFKTLGLKKIFCEVLDFNTSVIKLHKKFGFNIEGVFRKHHKFNEDFIDIYRMALIDDEWEEMREDIESRLKGSRNER